MFLFGKKLKEKSTMEKIQRDKYIATVGDLIDHLQKNFKPEDKLCFFDEGGAYINLEQMPKDFLGDRFFLYIKDFKEKSKKNGFEDDDELFNYVEDDNVIVY